MFAGLRSAQYNWKGGNTFLRQHLLPSSHMKSTELCLPCRHPDISAAPSRDYCYYYSVLSLFQAKLAYKRCLTAEFNAGEEPHSWPVFSHIAEQIQLPAHAPKGLWANVSKEEQRSLMHWPSSSLTHSGGRGFGNQRAEAVEHEMQAELQHLQQGGRKEIFFGLKSVTEQNINTVRQLSWDYHFTADNYLVLLEGIACLSAPSISCILCRPGNISVCTITQRPAWLGLLG